MKRSLASRVDRHFARLSALAAATALGCPAAPAEAGIVYSGSVNIPIPGNVDGVYLNVITGATGTSGAGTAGWDINPYFGANTFFAAAPQYGTIASGTNVANLASGTVIDGSNATATVTNGALFPTAAPGGLYGFRFQDEGNGNAVRYGWARIIRGAATTATGTIVEYAYEDSGAGIAAGDVGNATGTCCYQDGTCQSPVNGSACIAAGGLFVVGATCASSECPPGGSCCLTDSTCAIRTAAACAAAGGVWAGAGTVCGTCSGACCSTDGTCTVVSAQTCAGSAGATYLGNGTSCASGNCRPISFLPLPLAYNWNGLVSATAEQGAGNYSDPNGYRAIADRGLLLGAAGSIASGVTGTDSMPYTIRTQDHALDIVHLGDRRTVANAARNWNGDGTNNNAAQPSWLLENDQATIAQVSPMSAVTATLTAESRIGVIYQISDSGGRFDCKLTFTDNSTATITMRAADWFSNNNPVHPGPTAGSGLIAQHKLGSYTATQDTDTANSTTNNLDVVEAVLSVPRLATDGYGNFAGKRLASISFQNPVSNANYPNSTPATGSGFAIIAATLSYPGGATCYANCDNSTTAPVLNVQDFSCFLTKYASGDSYANCDNSTTPPVLNVQDFSCFLTKYASGCP